MLNLGNMDAVQLAATVTVTYESLKKPGSKALTAARRAYWRKVQAEVARRLK